jgi:hypothetical protein
MTESAAGERDVSADADGMPVAVCPTDGTLIPAFELGPTVECPHCRQRWRLDEVVARV